MNWTNTLQDWFGLHNSPLVEFITDAGGPIGWLVLLHMVFIFAGVTRGLQLSAIGALTLLSNTWLKVLIAEPRPFWVSSDVQALRTIGGFGMPSGHAQGAAAFWGYAGYLLARSGLKPTTNTAVRVALFVSIGFIALALATGLSRVYLGVHSVAQVLIGWALGFAALYVVLRAWPRITSKLMSVTLKGHLLMLIAACLAALGVDALVSWVHTTFQLDPSWLTNAQTAADRLGNDDTFTTQDDLQLRSSGSAVLILLVAGYALVGILNHRWPVTLATIGQKLATVAIHLVFTALFIWLASGLQEAAATGPDFIQLLMVAIWTFLTPACACTAQCR